MGNSISGREKKYFGATKRLSFEQVGEEREGKPSFPPPPHLLGRACWQANEGSVVSKWVLNYCHGNEFDLVWISVCNSFHLNGCEPGLALKLRTALLLSPPCVSERKRVLNSLAHVHALFGKPSLLVARDLTDFVHLDGMSGRDWSQPLVTGICYGILGNFMTYKLEIPIK